MSLDLKIREKGGAVVVDLSGRLTLGEEASKLRQQLQEITAAGKKKILLNLAALTYVDSCGIGLLVGTYATMSRIGGQFKLANLNNRVRDLLLITKLYTVFEVYNDEGSALASFLDIETRAAAHRQ